MLDKVDFTDQKGRLIVSLFGIREAMILGSYLNIQQFNYLF